MSANLMKVNLDADTSGFVDGLNKIKSEGKNLNKELKGLQKEIQKMSLAYDEMDEEAKNSKFGEYLKEQIDIATQEAGRLKDIQMDIAQNINNIASDTAGWDAMKQGIEVVNSSVQAFASSLGIAKEDGTLMANALNLIAVSQTATNAAITIGNALQQQSALRIGLRRAAVLADNAATKIATVLIGAHSTAMVGDTVATGAATTATNLFKKALISTGIGAIIVAVGTLVAYFDDLVDAVKGAVTWLGKITGLVKEETVAEKAEAEAKRKRAEAAEELRKKEKSLRDNAADTLAQYYKLQAIWKDTKSISERKRFVEEYKNEMKQLGIECNNTADAEKAFSSGGAAAFAMGLESRIRMMIKQEELMKLIREEMEAAQTPGNWEGPKALERKNRIRAIEEEIAAEVRLQQSYAQGYSHHSNGGNGHNGSNGTNSKTDSKKQTPEEEAAERLKKANDEYQAELKRLKALKEQYKNDNGIYGESKYQEDVNKAKQTYKNAIEKDFNYADKELRVRYKQLSVEVDEYNFNQITDKAEAKLKEQLANLNKTETPKYEHKAPVFYSSKEEAEQDKALQKLETQRKKYEDIQKQIAELEKVLNNADPAVRKTDTWLDANDQLTELYNNAGIALKELNSLAKGYDDLVIKQKLAAQESEALNNAISNIGSAFSSLGQAIGDTDGQWLSFVGNTISSTAQMMSQLAQLVVANQAAATAQGIKSASGLAFPYNLAAIATVVATIASIFASIPKFATGGIVPGSSTIGDKQLVRVNSGEMILNTAQQRRLFAMLNGVNMTGRTSSSVITTTVIKGDDIYVTQRNRNNKYKHLV